MINMKNTIDDLEKSNLELNGKYEEEVKQRTGKIRTILERQKFFKTITTQVLIFQI